MVQAVARWRSIGKRYTDPNALVELCVQALTTVGGGTEGGIDRVDFSVSVNGGAASITSVSSLKECHPEHSEAANLIPGAAAGALAGFPGYKLDVDLTSIGYGKIEVTATVYSVAGTATPLDTTLILHNDSDGTDRRPSTKDLWVDYVNGSDSNLGTEASPFKHWQKAMQGEMGGSTVHLKAGLHITEAPFGTSTTWYTSNGHWVTIVGEPGSLVTRPDPTATYFMVATGNGPGSAVRMRLKTVAILNQGPTWYTDSTIPTEVWLDGCIHYGQYWTPSKPWSVLTLRATGFTVGFTATSTNTRVYATNTLWLGVTNGPDRFYSLHDCIVSDFMAVAITSFNNSSLCNVLVQRQRAYRDVAGRVSGLLTGCVISIPVAGQMRIDALGPLVFASEGAGLPMDIGTVQEIAGSTDFSVECSGFTAAGNNGQFQVISAGSSNSLGFGYMILRNPLAVAGSVGAGATVRTWGNYIQPPPFGIPTDLFHPDILFMSQEGSTGQTNSLHYGLAGSDVDSAQSFFQGNLTQLHRCAFWNCREGSNRALVANMGSGADNCLLFNNTIAGQFSFGGNQTGTQLINNVFGIATGISGALTVDRNHFISGSTFGSTNATTGAWFETNQFATPWSYEPQLAKLSTGSTAVPDLEAFWWVDATANTRGCFRDTGLLYWTLPDAGILDVQAQPFTDTITFSVPSVSVLIGVSVTVSDVPGLTFSGGPDASASVGTITPPKIPTNDGGSSGGRPTPKPPRAHVKGNPVKNLPIPRADSVKIPMFWRSRQK